MDTLMDEADQNLYLIEVHVCEYIMTQYFVLLVI